MKQNKQKQSRQTFSHRKGSRHVVELKNENEPVFFVVKREVARVGSDPVMEVLETAKGKFVLHDSTLR